MLKKILFSLLISFNLLNMSTVFANTTQPIHTLKSMREIMPYIDAGTLVIFDLDHTVFEGKHYGYGHANWFYDQIEKGKQKGVDEKATIAKMFPHWLHSQKTAAMKPVEPITPALIANLQKQNHLVIGLTSRQVPLADITLKQLQDIGIDFSSAQLPNDAFAMDFSAPTLYKKGVVFSSDYNDKGEVLKAFLHKVNVDPKQIVIIDDSMRNIKSVINAYSDKVQVVGLYYPLVNQQKAKDWDGKAAHAEYCAVYRNTPELNAHPLECE